MGMFDHTQYVPIIKGRRGEYRALATLAPDVMARLTPIIEIPPIDWDHENETPMRTVDAHVGRVAPALQQAWGVSRSFFVDGLWIEDAGLMANGRHPLVFIVDEARERGLQPVPVTGMSRSPEYQAAVAEVAAQDGLGYCLRLESNDLPQVAELHQALEELGLPGVLANIDLVIDLKELPMTQIGPLGMVARAVLTTLPALQEWRSLTLAGAGFPMNLSGQSALTASMIPRTEYRIWGELIAADPPVRLPSFGDYAIAHPQPADVDPRIMRMSANLRYTVEQDWLVVKGRNTKQHGNEEFRALCQWLITQPSYRGPDFSWGDGAIHRCATGVDGPGNPTTWRQIGTSHHLTQVVRQLANVFGP
jgi:hypothetical protein